MTQEILNELRKDLSEANDKELMELELELHAEMKGRGLTIGN